MRNANLGHISWLILDWVCYRPVRFIMWVESFLATFIFNDVAERANELSNDTATHKPSWMISGSL